MCAAGESATFKAFRWHRERVRGSGLAADAEAARRTVLDTYLSGNSLSKDVMADLAFATRCTLEPSPFRLQQPVPTSARPSLWRRMLGTRPGATPSLEELVGPDVVTTLRRSVDGGGIVPPFRETLLGRVWGLLPPSFPEQVIYNDIQRSLWTLYPREEERDANRMDLKECLYRILLHNPSNSPVPVFHYYQGLHEILGHVMYVLNSDHELTLDTKVGICEVMVQRFFSPMCAPSMQTSEELLLVVYFLLESEAPEVGRNMEQLLLGPRVHFALSWVLTWFCYVVSDRDTMHSVIDLLLTMSAPTGGDQSHVILYWCAAILRLHAGSILLSFDGEDPDMCMGRAYSEVSALPKRLAVGNTAASDGILVGDVFKEACRLRRKYPDATKYTAIVSRHINCPKLERGGWLLSPLRAELRECAGLSLGRTMTHRTRVWITVGVTVAVVAVLMKYMRLPMMMEWQSWVASWAERLRSGLL